MCCELWWRFWLCYVLTFLKCIDKFIVIGHLVSELAIIYNSSSVWNRFKTVGHLKSCLVSIRLKVLEAVGNPSINRTELFTTENICQGKLETGNFKFYKKPKSMLILNISPSQKKIIIKNIQSRLKSVVVLIELENQVSSFIRYICMNYYRLNLKNGRQGQKIKIL